MKICKLLLAPVLTWALLSPVAAKEPGNASNQVKTVETVRLSLDKAIELARAAIDACRKKGIQVGVTVVDRNGLVQVTLRDTLAAPLTLKISKMKAYTTANFNVPTSALTRQANSSLANVEGLMMNPGGIPIHVGGKLLGAVAVSGAPSGKTDEECAKAGVQKLVGELEMDL